MNVVLERGAEQFTAEKSRGRMYVILTSTRAVEWVKKDSSYIYVLEMYPVTR